MKKVGDDDKIEMIDNIIILCNFCSILKIFKSKIHLL